MSVAVAALAIASAVQQKAMRRKANRKELLIALLAWVVWAGSRPGGMSMAASLVRLDRSSWRAEEGKFILPSWWSRRVANALTMRIPKTAMASRPATRATALLIPEAAPANF